MIEKKNNIKIKKTIKKFIFILLYKYNLNRNNEKYSK